MSSAFSSDAATATRAKELGLGTFKFYVIGPGGVLGDVDPGVVVSPFGWFAPGAEHAMFSCARCGGR